MTDLLIRLFIKNKHNISGVQRRHLYGRFACVVGIVTNILLFAIKIAIGIVFNSIAITADAVNNLSDSGSSLVTLLGFKISDKPADADHPYGHARMEYISGLIVSFIILALGLQLIQSSLKKIMTPEESILSLIALSALGVSILIKLWQCLFYRRIGREINSTTLLATSIDSRNDILATSAVLIAALITRMTGVNLDGYMGAGVAVFILISGTRLVMETISPLLGTAPEKELVDRIYKKIRSYDGIIGLHDLSVHNYGEGKCFASVHCEVSAEQDIMISHDIIDIIERDFLKDMGIHMVIHLDPVVTDDERTNELKAMVEEVVYKISPKIGMHDFRVVWGVSHSNLIFDVVVAFDFELSDIELAELISDEIHKINPTYHAVITVDHSYVPNRDV